MKQKVKNTINIIQKVSLKQKKTFSTPKIKRTEAEIDMCVLLYNSIK